MRYCKKCILPETYPGITFNQEGICNFCQQPSITRKELEREKLVEVLNSKNKKGAYDCVVPMSGGKDSSYILYYTVKKLGLRPLVVSYNSGYQTKIAEDNVRNACEILGVPVKVIKSPGKIQTKLLRTSYLLSKKSGGAWGPCGNCEAIIRTVSMNIARKHKIPFVMWGSSALESMDSKKYELRNSGKENPNLQKRRNNILNRFFKLAFSDPSRAWLQFKYNILSVTQRITLKFPLRYALNPKTIPPLSKENPRFILFFDYIQWNSIGNVALLESEMGWKYPTGRDSRFDCSLHCVSNAHYLKEYGISNDGVGFSSFVREGKMNRDEAISRERAVENSTESDYQALVDKIL